MYEQTKLTDNSWVVFVRNFIPSDEADRLLERLLTLPWEQKQVIVRGKAFNQPRLIAWAGELPYRYSHLTLAPRPWPTDVKALQLRTMMAGPYKFNHVLLNHYRDGNDSIGFHADNEPELGPNPTIASISFGATRTFFIRPREKGAKHSFIALSHGSLLIMGGAFQREFTHGVDKEPKVTKPRINLTFRNLLRAPE